MKRYVTSTTPTIPLPPKSMEESQKNIAELARESSMWEGKYRVAEREKDAIIGLLEQEVWKIRKKDEEIAKLKDSIKEKDAILDRIPGSKKTRMNFFAGAHPDFEE